MPVERDPHRSVAPAIAAGGELLHSGSQHLTRRRHAGAEQIPIAVVGPAVRGAVPHQHVVRTVERDGGRPAVQGGRDRYGDPAGIEHLPVRRDAGRVHVRGGGRSSRRSVLPGYQEVNPVECDCRLAVYPAVRVNTVDHEVLTDVDLLTREAGRAFVAVHVARRDRSQRERREARYAQQAKTPRQPHNGSHRASPSANPTTPY